MAVKDRRDDNDLKHTNRVDIHIHHTVDNGNQANNKEVLKAIKELREEMMAKMEDFQSALQQVDAETTRIGDYIQQLLAQLNRTDLTDEQESQILASLSSAAERLKSVGVSVNEPVPTDPLPEIPV